MPLSVFHPVIAEWFRKRFTSPTDVQVRSWPEIGSGNDVLIVATQIDDFELARRLWLTRPDPQWHVQKRQEFLKEKNAYAAALHHSWEQHARGVVAFDSGDFNKALAHFIAAAALKPRPGPPPQIKPLPGPAPGK